MLYNVYWTYKLHKIGFTISLPVSFTESLKHGMWKRKYLKLKTEANMESLETMEDKLQR